MLSKCFESYSILNIEITAPRFACLELKTELFINIKKYNKFENLQQQNRIFDGYFGLINNIFIFIRSFSSDLYEAP
jgi:hypothetical protein